MCVLLISLLHFSQADIFNTYQQSNMACCPAPQHQQPQSNYQIYAAPTALPVGIALYETAPVDMYALQSQPQQLQPLQPHHWTPPQMPQQRMQYEQHQPYEQLNNPQEYNLIIDFVTTPTLRLEHPSALATYKFDPDFNYFPVAHENSRTEDSPLHQQQQHDPHQHKLFLEKLAFLPLHAQQQLQQTCSADLPGALAKTPPDLNDGFVCMDSHVATGKRPAPQCDTHHSTSDASPNIGQFGVAGYDPNWMFPNAREHSEPYMDHHQQQLLNNFDQQRMHEDVQFGKHCNTMYIV